MVINNYWRSCNSINRLENRVEVYMSSEIKYSKNTVGCSVGGEIFIHPELYTVPELYKAVVNHEKRHSDGLNGQDIAIDIFNDEFKECKKEFYLFMLKHPRTMMGYLPFSKIGKHWTFDFQILVAWIMILGIGYFVGVNL